METCLGSGEDAIFAVEGPEGSLGRLLEGLVPELFAQSEWSRASTQERLDEMRRELDDVSAYAKASGVAPLCICEFVSIRFRKYCVRHDSKCLS